MVFFQTKSNAIIANFAETVQFLRFSLTAFVKDVILKLRNSLKKRGFHPKIRAFHV